MTEHDEPRHICPWLFGGAAVIGGAIAGWRLATRPNRAVIVDTETRGEWMARLIQMGRWSEELLAWEGSTRFEIEIVGPDNSLHRIKTNIGKLEHARDYARLELSRRARKSAE